MATADQQRIAQLERDRDRHDRQLDAMTTLMTEIAASNRAQWAALAEREKNRDEAIRRIDENCRATRTYTDAELARIEREDQEHRKINVQQVGIAVAAVAAVIAALITAIGNTGSL